MNHFEIQAKFIPNEKSAIETASLLKDTGTKKQTRKEREKKRKEKRRKKERKEKRKKTKQNLFRMKNQQLRLLGKKKQTKTKKDPKNKNQKSFF